MAITLYDDGNHKCITFPDLVTCGGEQDQEKACESVQSNQFLIINNGNAALIDPGGNLTYSRLFMEISAYIKPKELQYVIASHQDPDIIASLNKWLVGTRCSAIVPKLWQRFVPHFCSPGATNGRLIGIPDRGMDISLGDTALKALPAHFMHSEGNFHFYDPVSKILFTGDVGSSHVEEDQSARPVDNFDKHVQSMAGFHRRYMNSNKVLRYWVNMVRTLDVEMIVPQHGAVFQGQKSIGQFLSWLENLKCGVDLVTQENYRIPA